MSRSESRVWVGVCSGKETAGASLPLLLFAFALRKTNVSIEALYDTGALLWGARGVGVRWSWRRMWEARDGSVFGSWSLVVVAPDEIMR